MRGLFAAAGGGGSCLKVGVVDGWKGRASSQGVLGLEKILGYRGILKTLVPLLSHCLDKFMSERGRPIETPFSGVVFLAGAHTLGRNPSRSGPRDGHHGLRMCLISLSLLLRWIRLAPFVSVETTL